MSWSPEVPVVAFHGFLGAPSLWGRTQALLPTWDFKAKWLPGHGLEPWSNYNFDFSEIIQELATTIPEGALLVGYSMGARVALSLLAMHPERFSGAISLSGHPGLENAEERAERAVWDEGQASLILREGVDVFAERWRSLPLFATQSNLDTVVLQEQQQARREHQVTEVAWAMRALGLGRMPPCWQALTPLAERVVLVSGALDAKFSSLMEQATKRFGAVSWSIEGVGHNLPLESPEKTAQVIVAGTKKILLRGERLCRVLRQVLFALGFLLHGQRPCLLVWFR